MGIFFVYILKSSVCLAVFYLFYRLLLSRETFHRFNRVALLSILLLSCLLPLMEVTVKEQTEVTQTMMTLEQWLMLADMLNAADATQVQAAEVTVTWIQVSLLIYLVGILFFAFRNGYSLLKLGSLLRSGKKEKLSKYIGGEEKATLIVHQQDISPFSWMKYIVISQKDLDENGREILIHELAHIQNRHSCDLLVADICIFFQWFNPASWLLKQELQNIHEYEADETVIEKGVDAKQYQLLLIKKAVGTRLYSMANSFNHSKLKKRITMMLKEKSSPWAKLKYLYVLPVAAIAVTAFARPEISETAEEISAVKVNDLTAIVEAKSAKSIEEPVQMALPDTAKPAEVKYIPAEATEQLEGTTVFEVVEQMPEFPNGGMPALMKYLQDNMRYPESAKENGTQGRVAVQFLIDKKGNVKNPQIIRSVDKDLDAEAIRLMKSMPKWKPGMQDGKAVNVKFTIPVAFKLKGGEMKSSSLVKSGKSSFSHLENMLYMIDGQEVSASIFKAINPNEIQSISVLKDKASLEAYGDKAKNGAVLITLRNGSSTSTTKTPVKGTLYENGILYHNGEIIELDGKDTEKTSAQGDMKVVGRVIDQYGEPVIGASVVKEGTTYGTITDVDGNFVLSASKGDKLIVAYINMASAKVEAAPELTVTLKDE